MPRVYLVDAKHKERSALRLLLLDLKDERVGQGFYRPAATLRGYPRAGKLPSGPSDDHGCGQRAAAGTG
jgi:hypothetical protein